MQLDIHILTIYCMLKTHDPKMERTVPPENGDPLHAHGLDFRGTWTEKRNTCTEGRAGRREAEVCRETASGGTFLIPPARYLLLGERRGWNRAK